MPPGAPEQAQEPDATAGAGELTLVAPLTTATAGAAAEGGNAGEPGARNGTLHLPREGASTSGAEPAGDHVLLSLQLKRGKVCHWEGCAPCTHM
jgi:hypothetical protein